MTHCVYVSRHVQFCENTFPYHGDSIQNLQTKTNIDYTHFSECLDYVSSSSHSFLSSPCLPCSDSPHLSSDPPPDLQGPISVEPLLDSTASDSTFPPPVSSIPRVTTSSHSMITRGKAGIFKPRLYHAMNVLSSFQTFQALLALKEPQGFKSTTKHPEWLSAMDDEIQVFSAPQ